MAPKIQESCEKAELNVENQGNTKPALAPFYVNDGSSDDNKNNASTATAEPRRRCVSFHPSVLRYGTIHLNDMADDEIEAVWFNVEEMIEIKERTKADAKKLENGTISKKDDFCFRGLECRTIRGMMSKRNDRVAAYNAVFFELDSQEAKENFSAYDDEAIADAYFMVTDPCQQTAEFIGRKDELEAKKIYNNSSNEYSLQNKKTMQNNKSFLNQQLIQTRNKNSITSSTEVWARAA